MEDNITISGRIKNAWNAFTKPEQTYSYQPPMVYGSSFKPDRTRFSRGNDRSIITSVLNRIALDISSIDIKHCKVDENGNFKEEVKSTLNECLTLEANIDQTSRNLIHDLVISMFDEGCVALVPTDTSVDPNNNNTYDVLTLRVGKIVQWFPTSVRLSVYNEMTGKKEEITLLKKDVAIIENPLYALMNEPNSTLRRLTRKLALLDSVDEQASSGKLDLIIQLPYVVKGEIKKQQASQRRADIESQLKDTKYGIAYTDATERITQLNRPIENNLMGQVEYLTTMLYSQLGITTSVMDGTADESTMINYYGRTVEPIVTAIVLELKRKFLTKTARTQGQTIMAFKDPFKLVPVSKLAELADKFTRNEILTSNEFRGVIGFKPSADPKADELRNSNLNRPMDPYSTIPPEGYIYEDPNEANYEQPEEEVLYEQ